MTASPATTLTTRLHALSVISHIPSINTTTTEESPRWAKTLYGQVPGRSSLAERKEAGVLGTAGPSNGVSQACQENFPDSDSPIATAPPDENSLQSPDERRPLFDSDILEARPHTPPISQRSPILIKLPSRGRSRKSRSRRRRGLAARDCCGALGPRPLFPVEDGKSIDDEKMRFSPRRLCSFQPFPVSPVP